MQFCKAPVFEVCTSRFPPHSPSWIMIAAPGFSLPFSSCSLFVIFLLFKAPWPQNRCLSDKFPESPAGRDRRKAEKEAGKRTWRERGSVWGIGQRGRGENGKRTGEKGRAWRKNKSGNGNRGVGQTGRKEAPVFLRNFSCEPLRQRGVRGDSPHGSPDFFRKFFRQLSAPLLRPEFCSRWEWRDRK